MSHKRSLWATLPGCLVLIFIAFAGFSLVKDHSSHLVQWAPFLIILLWPFMHFFMHRGHGHDRHNSNNPSAEMSDLPEQGSNEAQNSSVGSRSSD